jgi:Protein of Unknown function (DUF2784)
MHLTTCIPAIYSGLAVATLVVHGLFILWVVFGAFLVKYRPWLRWLHIASITWGLLTEFLPWPCPLTLLEDWLELKAGTTPEQGGFMLRYMDKLVYPDVATLALMIAAALIGVVNFSYYGWQVWNARSWRARQGPEESTLPL